jgi:hypothetical protein
MRLTVNSPTDILQIFRAHSPEPRLRTALYRAGFGVDFATNVTRSGNMYLSSALLLLESVGLWLRLNDHPIMTKSDAVDLLDHYRTESMYAVSKRAGYDGSHFSKCVKSRSIRLFVLLTYVETMGLDLYVEAPDP